MSILNPNSKDFLFSGPQKESSLSHRIEGGGNYAFARAMEANSHDDQNGLRDEGRSVDQDRNPSIQEYRRLKKSINLLFTLSVFMGLGYYNRDTIKSAFKGWIGTQPASVQVMARIADKKGFPKGMGDMFTAMFCAVTQKIEECEKAVPHIEDLDQKAFDQRGAIIYEQKITRKSGDVTTIITVPVIPSWEKLGVADDGVFALISEINPEDKKARIVASEHLGDYLKDHRTVLVARIGTGGEQYGKNLHVQSPGEGPEFQKARFQPDLTFLTIKNSQATMIRKNAEKVGDSDQALALYWPVDLNAKSFSEAVPGGLYFSMNAQFGAESCSQNMRTYKALGSNREGKLVMVQVSPYVLLSPQGWSYFVEKMRSKGIDNLAFSDTDLSANDHTFSEDDMEKSGGMGAPKMGISRIDYNVLSAAIGKKLAMGEIGRREALADASTTLVPGLYLIIEDKKADAIEHISTVFRSEININPFQGFKKFPEQANYFTSLERIDTQKEILDKRTLFTSDVFFNYLQRKFQVDMSSIMDQIAFRRVGNLIYFYYIYRSDQISSLDQSLDQDQVLGYEFGFLRRTGPNLEQVNGRIGNFDTRINMKDEKDSILYGQINSQEEQQVLDKIGLATFDITQIVLSEKSTEVYSYVFSGHEEMIPAYLNVVANPDLAPVLNDRLTSLVEKELTVDFRSLKNKIFWGFSSGDGGSGMIQGFYYNAQTRHYYNIVNIDLVDQYDNNGSRWMGIQLFPYLTSKQVSGQAGDSLFSSFQRISRELPFVDMRKKIPYQRVFLSQQDDGTFIADLSFGNVGQGESIRSDQLFAAISKRFGVYFSADSQPHFILTSDKKTMQLVVTHDGKQVAIMKLSVVENGSPSVRIMMPQRSDDVQVEIIPQTLPRDPEDLFSSTTDLFDLLKKLGVK
jgi:hypothetical protein